MKNVLLFMVSIMLTTPLFAQTATSIANGTWLNPLNWDCMCVPLPGYNIIINHAITLNTDFGYTSGSIIISTTGALIQDATPRNIVSSARFRNRGVATFNALLINGDTVINESTGTMNLVAFSNFNGLLNHGTMNLDSFYNDKYLQNSLNATINARQFYNSGTFENIGMISVDSFYNSRVIQNTGTIDVSSFLNTDEVQNYKNIYQIINASVARVDSLYNAGVLINHSNARIDVDSITNSGNFTNNGFLNFGDFTNLGTTHNNFSMTGTRNFWNDGQFDNNFNATMTLGISFYNGDTIFTPQVADFKNNGSVVIGDSWFSTDTVSGAYPGSFRIQNITSNSGNMIGSYDFCDLTPPATSPYIDFNIGYVDNNITYCTATAVSEISLTNNIQIFPNPVQNQVFINIEQAGVYHIELFNAIGQIVLQQQVENQGVLDWNDLGNGIYWLRILNDHQEILKVEKLNKI